MFVYYSDICVQNRHLLLDSMDRHDPPGDAGEIPLQEGLNSDGVKPVYFLNTLLKYCGLSP